MSDLKNDYYEITEIMDALRVSFKKLAKCNQNPFRKIDFRVLHLIIDSDELTMQTLADEMAITKSRVTAIITKLMERNLVTTEVAKDDKRKKILRLTKDGEKQIADFKKMHEEFFLKMWQNYTQEEVTQWKNLMQKMILIIEKEVSDYEKSEEGIK